MRSTASDIGRQNQRTARPLPGAAQTNPLPSPGSDPDQRRPSAPDPERRAERTRIYNTFKSPDELRDTWWLWVWLTRDQSRWSPPLFEDVDEELFGCVLDAAEHALMAGKNPVALFARNVAMKEWRGTEESRRRAEARLREWRHSVNVEVGDEDYRLLRSVTRVALQLLIENPETATMGGARRALKMYAFYQRVRRSVAMRGYAVRLAEMFKGPAEDGDRKSKDAMSHDPSAPAAGNDYQPTGDAQAFLRQWERRRRKP